MADGKKSGLAIASLILGILSFVMFGILSAIPGVITGHMARSRAKNDPAQYGGQGLAMAGLILSYAAIVLSIAAIFFFINNPEFFEMLEQMQQEGLAQPAPAE